MFLPPDMASVKDFRKELRNSLLENGFREEDIAQVELAADEALTNSVSANVVNRSEETIICRWTIRDFKLTLYIVDYGKGIRYDMSKEAINESKKNLPEFLKHVRDHQSNKSEEHSSSGVDYIHKNSGQGLNIIHALMDSVKIMYHGEGAISDNPKASDIMGSILQLRFDAHKKH
ncbi:MAG: ATP-binding protein [Leptospira sp.]|nr:ATP-binding protein [Leptospira sp.]